MNNYEVDVVANRVGLALLWCFGCIGGFGASRFSDHYDWVNLGAMIVGGFAIQAVLGIRDIRRRRKK